MSTVLNEYTYIHTYSNDPTSLWPREFIFGMQVGLHIHAGMQAHHRYNLRPIRHELVLAVKGDAQNFLERQLFKDTYYGCFTAAFAVVILRLYVYSFHLCTVAFCQPNFTH